MPELPEVETTTNGLKAKILGLKIKDIWTDLNTKDTRKTDTVANPKFFSYFKKEILNREVLSVERRAKNILINISNGKTILIHLKMTGHLLFGKYKFEKQKNVWIPAENGPLNDPFNRFVHAVFIFSNGKHLAFSDTRKFGKMTLLNTDTAHKSKHLENIGPEPLSTNFGVKELKERLSKKPNGKIKTVLMDQNIIAGIGNIYSDEILFKTGIHPERRASELKESEIKEMLKNIKELLKKGIDFGGDSMSDYRNIEGEKGKFQLHHQVYRKTREKCGKKGCGGIILRKIINGRSAHFCPVHQK